MDATTIAMCDLEDRIASETGLSEQTLRQLMKAAFLLERRKSARWGRRCSPGRWCRSPSTGRQAQTLRRSIPPLSACGQETAPAGSPTCNHGRHEQKFGLR